MRPQHFRMAAQNSIDAIDKLINNIKYQLKDNNSASKAQLKLKIQDFEKDLEILISKYNALETSNKEDSERTMNAFKLCRDTLKGKILGTFQSK